MMKYEEIQKLYQEKPKYVRELDSSTHDYSRLLIETVEWKIPHLMNAIPYDFTPNSVVEVGCFCGHLIGNMLVNGKSDFERYGYDINSNAIEIARKNYVGVDFFCEDAFETNRKFDLLILSDIVEHIEDDIGFLNKSRSISGAVVLNLPLEKSISTAKREYGFSDPSGHLRAYSLKDALALIEKANFSIVSCHTVCVIDSPVFKKIKQLVPTEVSKPLFKKAKKKVIENLQGLPMFNRIYHSSNLFAFLTPN